MDNQELIFRQVITAAVKADGSKSFLTQGFDNAVADSLEQRVYLPYVCLCIGDTVNRLLLFQFLPPCWFRHELSRLPPQALNLSEDEWPVHPPATCPMRMQNGGCGHPEQTGLLWLFVRAIILANRQDEATKFLAPVFDLMKQDALFWLMVQQGEQISPMDSGGKSQQNHHTARIRSSIGEIVWILRSTV